MRIQHNISALNSHRQLGNNNSAIGKNLEKLSSGYRINRAGDDAAGLAISEKMRAQIKGLETAQKNAQDGISLVQTAEGALTEVHSMLNRMVELATQSANGTYDDKVDRANLEKEVNSLKSEIDRISDSTNFNGIKLLDGSMKSEAVANVKKSITESAADAAIAKDQVQFDVKSKEAGVEVEFKAVTENGANEKVTAAWVGDKLTISIGSKANSGAQEVTQEELDKAIKAAGGTKSAKAGDDFAVTLTDGPIKIDDVAATGNDVVLATATTEEVIGKDLTLQVGDTNENFQKVTVSVGKMNSEALKIKEISVADQSKAGDAIKNIKEAINTVSSTRGDLGAIQNRLEHTINNLGVTTENMTAAESRIRDVDMAKEMMEFTKNNILSQAATSMLAQANQTPQGVLQLLNELRKKLYMQFQRAWRHALFSLIFLADCTIYLLGFIESQCLDALF